LQGAPCRPFSGLPDSHGVFSDSKTFFSCALRFPLWRHTAVPGCCAIIHLHHDAAWCLRPAVIVPPASLFSPCRLAGRAAFCRIRPDIENDTAASLMPSSKSAQYWLMKSEPDECSIDDALSAPGRTVPWTGVRNYQARNFMRDLMQPGDGVLFYHSSCAEPGIAGLAEVASAPYPDATQFDPSSKYYDAASPRTAPRWIHVDIRALRKTRLIGIGELRGHPELQDMVVLRRGNRLSITPVTAQQWRFITARLLGARIGKSS
jgi:predicted RNA-binding protein with PUA-like domain